MAEEIILRTKGRKDSVSKEDVESCDLWIHDGLVMKNTKKILLNYDFGKEGDGTRENPFIQDSTSADKYKYIAMVLGYKKTLRWLNEGEKDIFDDENFFERRVKYFYAIYDWKRSSSFYDSWWTWSSLIWHIEMLRHLGYPILKQKIAKESLLNLDFDALENEVIKSYQQVWDEINPRLSMNIKEGQRAQLTINIGGKTQTIKGNIVSIKKKLYFISDKQFKKSLFVSSPAKKGVAESNSIESELIMNEIEEGEYPNVICIGRIKIPVFDSGTSTIGAIKYNNFEIIK